QQRGLLRAHQHALRKLGPFAVQLDKSYLLQVSLLNYSFVLAITPLCRASGKQLSEHDYGCPARHSINRRSGNGDETLCGASFHLRRRLPDRTQNLVGLADRLPSRLGFAARFPARSLCVYVE